MLGTALVLAWLGAEPSASAAGPNPYLLQARRLYEEVQYEQCVGRLDQATRWDNTAEERVDIELYAALCKYPLGRTEEARQHFELALMLDANAQVPPTSPKISALFEEVKAKVRSDAPMSRPEQRLSDPRSPLTEPLPSTHAAAAAPEPSPARDTTRRLVGPAILGGGALGALTVGVVSGLRAQQLAQAANTTRFQSDAFEGAHSARGAAQVANVAYVGAGALLAGAVTWFILGQPNDDDRSPP